MLALVLLAVLVWYTVISPSYAAAPLRVTDSESEGAEEREVETQAALGFSSPRAARVAGPRPVEFGANDDEDELDWPEIIDYD